MKNKILNLLKNDFVSGEQIAKTLSISRTAVWKQINSIRKSGYEIESIKNRGYRLISRPDIPLPEEITDGLSTKIIGKETHYFKKISSTNDLARQLINKNAIDGTVIVSDIQTQGRGRKDRTWFSPTGGLWFSIILYPKLPPNKSMMLTMAASLSVVHGIKTTTGIIPRIKWPNDVLIKEKKVCGILTEIDAEIDKINFAIVGIGLNVNNTLQSDLSKHATTLKTEYGGKVSRVQILKSILKNFDEYYIEIQENKHDKIRENWLSSSQIIDKKVRINDGTKTIQGVVKNIDEDGSLILDVDNKTCRVLSGDLEYL
ncbi:MAG: biotin--[acetyl-CoA-carboxylase] ligase [Candidatus Thermoplasmatota archaeon]|jgi:BirA family biotin operon repressor/biotin-[acetyl-CoA-carboxylase] ligase|nr:biotin--[acetyl-CoA-carboxylase] ligase [Candidatus Thermoplasmatota archaeon]